MINYSQFHNIIENLENVVDNIYSQPYYWGRALVAFNSWKFRMLNLSNEDLMNKVPKNSLGIYSPYCDKSNWSQCSPIPIIQGNKLLKLVANRNGKGEGIKNFWMILNEGYYDMLHEFYDY